jgi:hypothetical protein
MWPFFKADDMMPFFQVGDMISVIDMPPPDESIWWRGKRGFEVCAQPLEAGLPDGTFSYQFRYISVPKSQFWYNLGTFL